MRDPVELEFAGNHPPRRCCLDTLGEARGHYIDRLAQLSQLQRFLNDRRFNVIESLELSWVGRYKHDADANFRKVRCDLGTSEAIPQIEIDERKVRLRRYQLQSSGTVLRRAHHLNSEVIKSGLSVNGCEKLVLDYDRSQ